MSIQKCSEVCQSLGHVFAAVAKADVARLVVDCAGEEQDAGIADNFFAEREDVAVRFEAHEADGAGVGLHPFKKIRPLAKEGIENRQVAVDDLQVALGQDVAMTQSQGGSWRAGIWR
jgi:hypothetical protein